MEKFSWFWKVSRIQTVKTGFICTFPGTDLLCQSSHTFCHFPFLLSGLAASQLWRIKMRKREVQAVAPSFTSVYFSENWDISTEKQEIIIKPLYDFCLIPHTERTKQGWIIWQEILEIWRQGQGANFGQVPPKMSAWGWGKGEGRGGELSLV